MTTQSQMAQSLVQVSGLARERRNLIPQDEALYQTAFDYWVGDGELNLAKTARKVGVNYDTLKKWARQNRWMEEYVESHGIITAPAVEAIASKIAGRYAEVVDSLFEVATNQEHPQMVAAGRLLKDFLLRPDQPVTNQSLTLVDARTLNSFERMTPEQIDNFVRDELQRNLDDSQSQRTRKTVVREVRR